MAIRAFARRAEVETDPVMDPETGMWVETVHFGHLQHENVVPLRLKKWVFLTSEDEWYKAAYYDAQSPSYFDYPAGSNTQTSCSASTVPANSAGRSGEMRISTRSSERKSDST